MEEGIHRGNVMGNQFREVEETFSVLKEKFCEAKISEREFVDTLKQLRIKDDEGRFWMIGAQTGKWYYFNGDDWVKAVPPSLGDKKAICILCGYENDIEAEVCVKCGGRGKDLKEAAEDGTCPQCGTRLANPDAPCPACAEAEAAAENPAAAEDLDLAPGGPTYVIRAVRPTSFFWFFGILGLFGGILGGLVIGVTSLFPGLAAELPGFFRDVQGKLVGGMIFTILGGLVGFVCFGAAGLLGAVISNGILSLTGGIKIHAVKAGRAEAREEKEESGRGPFF